MPLESRYVIPARLKTYNFIWRYNSITNSYMKNTRIKSHRLSIGSRTGRKYTSNRTRDIEEDEKDYRNNTTVAIRKEWEKGHKIKMSKRSNLEIKQQFRALKTRGIEQTVTTSTSWRCWKHTAVLREWRSSQFHSSDSWSSDECNTAETSLQSTSNHLAWWKGTTALDRVRYEVTHWKSNKNTPDPYYP